jgi:UDP:flavonoid glycosyltransferase YjiC (YdhE family)
MHITILALGSRGDIQPYANLGRGLQQAGHQVRFVTFESFAPLVADLEFHPIHGDAQSLVTGAGADMLALVGSFGSLAQGYADDLSDPRLGETDLILNQLPGGFYGYDLAEKYNLRMALVSVIPIVRTSAYPMMGFPRLPLPGYNKLSYRLAEQMAWGMFRATINRWRKQTLQLPPHPFGGYFSKLGTQQIPIVNGVSPQIVPRPKDWAEHIHLTGYWFPHGSDWQPSPELQTFIETGPPPVFIGFGSMPIREPARATELILEAVRQSGQRAILHMGWGGLGDRTLPDFAFNLMTGCSRAWQ